MNNKFYKTFIILLLINGCVTTGTTFDEISIACDALKKDKINQYIAISCDIKNLSNQDTLVEIEKIGFPGYGDKITVLLPHHYETSKSEYPKTSASSLSFATLPFATTTGNSSGSAAIAALFTLITVAAAYHAHHHEKPQEFKYQDSFLLQKIKIKKKESVKRLLFIQLESNDKLPSSIELGITEPKDISFVTTLKIDSKFFRARPGN